LRVNENKKLDSNLIQNRCKEMGEKRQELTWHQWIEAIVRINPWPTTGSSRSSGTRPW
jgi:hypothetical protein